MATGAKAAFGSLLKIGDGAASEVFNTIIELNNIDGPSMSRRTIDVTHMESPNARREKLGGFRDGGEISFEGSFVSTNTIHKQLFTDKLNRTLRNFRLIQRGALKTVAVNAGGTGYTVGDLLTVGGREGTVAVTTVAGGVVTGISIRNPGAGYEVANGLTVTGGTGTGATINLTAIDVATLTFTAYITSLRKTYPFDGAMGLSGSLKVSGPVTVT